MRAFLTYRWCNVACPGYVFGLGKIQMVKVRMAECGGRTPIAMDHHVGGLIIMARISLTLQADTMATQGAEPALHNQGVSSQPLAGAALVQIWLLSQVPT